VPMLADSRPAGQAGYRAKGLRPLKEADRETRTTGRTR
jgi:hypothetical protein